MGLDCLISDKNQGLREDDHCAGACLTFIETTSISRNVGRTTSLSPCTAYPARHRTWLTKGAQSLLRVAPLLRRSSRLPSASLRRWNI